MRTFLIAVATTAVVHGVAPYIKNMFISLLTSLSLSIFLLSDNKVDAEQEDKGR